MFVGFPITMDSIPSWLPIIFNIFHLYYNSWTTLHIIFEFSGGSDGDGNVSDGSSSNNSIWTVKPINNTITVQLIVCVDSKLLNVLTIITQKEQFLSHSGSRCVYCISNHAIWQSCLWNKRRNYNNYSAILLC